MTQGIRAVLDPSRRPAFSFPSSPARLTGAADLPSFQTPLLGRTGESGRLLQTCNRGREGEKESEDDGEDRRSTIHDEEAENRHSYPHQRPRSRGSLLS
ncbi:hypothetical protein ACLOJK_030338 [Asimina triloba]